MSYRDDIYSNEAMLVNNAKRELANGMEKNVIYKLRLNCFSKGVAGIMNLAKTLRKMEKNMNNSLDLKDFIEGLKQSGIDCSQNETEEIFRQCSDNVDDCLNISDFLTKLRPSISRPRFNIINKVFEKIDANSDGLITVEELRSMYNVRDHPKYLSGDLSETEIMQTFLANFLGGQTSKSESTQITKEDFINYYAAISVSIDNDAYFDLVMRRAYKL